MSRIQRIFDGLRRPFRPQAIRSTPVSSLWGGYGWGTYGDNADVRWDKWGAALAAVTNEAAYRCIVKRAETVGSTPWQIVDARTGDVLVTSADSRTDNPLARAIERYETRHMVSLFSMWELSECVAGETFIELVTNELDAPSDIEWLNPLGVQIIATQNIINRFQYSGFGASVSYAPDELLYARNPLDLRSDVFGYSPLMTAIGSHTLGVSRNSARVLSAFFRNDASPAWIGMPAGRFADTGWSEQQTDTVVKQIRENHMGVADKFRAAIFPYPINVTHIPLPELDKWAVLLRDIEPRIYTAFGVPRSVAGDSDSTRYQASPDDVPNFYATITSRLRAIETAINAGLVPFFEGDMPPYRFVFDYSGYAVLKPEAVTPYSTMFRDGAVTLNEYRQRVGMETVDGGDVLMLPTGVTLTPLAQVQQMQAPMTPIAVDKPAPVPQVDPVADGAPQLPMLEAPADELRDSVPDTDTTQAALDELRAWRKFVGNGKAQKRAFVTEALPDYIALAVRAALRDGDTGVFRRYEAVLAQDASLAPLPDVTQAYEACLRAWGIEDAHITPAVKAHALGVLAAKAIQSTRLDFEMVLEDVFPEAVAGNVNKRRFKLILNNAIAVACRKAFTDGYRDGGVIVELSDLEEDELDWLDAHIDAQRGYVDAVSDAIFADGKVTLDEAANKPEMWFNKSVFPAYQQALSFASQNGVFEWVLGEAEHCDSCNALSGQRRRMKVWDATIKPKASELQCGGYRCACNLVPSRERVSRGRIPQWRFSKSHEGHSHEHVGRFRH